ncbi:MAG: hypothetical protein AAGD11_06930 [Planctomycetota bacterium]
MPPQAQKFSAPSVPQIQCCEQRLPLRLTQNDEPAAVWLCAKCSKSFVACCIKEELIRSSHLIRLDERSFDTSGAPQISLGERQRASRLASRPIGSATRELRRSERVSQSMVVPAVLLSDALVPEGEPFPLMVSNLSKEGVGMIHDDRIDTEYLAIELSPTSQSPIQVILQVVRQRELTPPYFEIGGEFVVRLGSLPVR